MKVYIMGEMGEKFGSEWNMQVEKISEVFQLIDCQRPGFRKYMHDAVQDGTNFTVKYGEEFLEEKDLLLSLNKEDVIITPIPAGADGDIGRIIVGVFMLVVAFYAPGTTSLFEAAMAGGNWMQAAAMAWVSIGVNLALTGIQGLLAPGPEMDKDTPDSYLFNGAQNNVAEGFPVPILYGEMTVGGAPINASFTTKKIVNTGWMYTEANAENSGFDPTIMDSGV